jgi:hypothetical protein
MPVAKLLHFVDLVRGLQLQHACGGIRQQKC